MVRIHFENERELDLKYAAFADVQKAIERVLNMEDGTNGVRYVRTTIIDNAVLINLDKITYIEEVN